MKKTTLLIIALLTSGYFIAQTTAIPDANFEQALINLGLDTGPLNGSVPTANIDTLLLLNVNSKSISDLTGIEGFTSLVNLSCGSNTLTNLNLTQNSALKYLNCTSNFLTTLNVTQNTSLINIMCSANQINNIDLTQNSALAVLWCNNNQFTSLNLTQNPSLGFFHCNDNFLTSLDLSQNTSLFNLRCHNNLLTCLNVKNGNNSNMSSSNFTAANNPNLNCIQVDNVSYSNTNWTSIDAGASFNTNCSSNCTVGIDEQIDANIIIYPNPSSTYLNIEGLNKPYNLTITNTLGQVLLVENDVLKMSNRIDISKFSNGLLFVKIESEGKVFQQKIIKK